MKSKRSKKNFFFCATIKLKKKTKSNTTNVKMENGIKSAKLSSQICLTSSNDLKAFFYEPITYKTENFEAAELKRKKKKIENLPKYVKKKGKSEIKPEQGFFLLVFQFSFPVIQNDHSSHT